MNQLRVYAPESGELLLDLEWELGKLTAKVAKRELIKTVERWNKQGLQEFIGLPGKRKYRETLSTEFLFLKNLSEYLQRCYGFIVDYKER